MSIRYCPIWIFIFYVLFVPFAYAGVTPPATSVVLDPSTPDGLNNWYISPVSVTLTANDLESGVKDINWNLNNAGWLRRSFSQTLNMIINSSFEQDSSGWVFSGDPTSMGSRTDEYAKFDLYSVKTASMQNSQNNWSNRSNYVVVTPWRTVNVGTWIKGDNINGTGASIKVYAITPTGDVLLYSSTPMIGTFDWTYVSRDVVVSADTAYGLYMTLSLDGVGTAYYDGVYVAYASEPTVMSFSVSTNGTNTLLYYSSDFAGNVETQKSVSFKIDLIAPTDWQNFETERSGNEHTLISRMDVNDNASGLNKDSAEFQYSVLNTWLWGYFSNLTSCSSTFNLNGWVETEEDFVNGDLSGTLATPAVDYCNSNWLLCKGLRFKIEDMAGNESIKQLCIKGPWVDVPDGNVISLGNINMTSAAPDFNSNSLIIAKDSISNFESSQGWELNYYDSMLDTDSLSYGALYEKLSPSNIVTDLPTSNGVFRTSGNFYVSNSTTPSDYSSRVFNNILFVNGDLIFNRDLISHAQAGTIFIVRDDVLVSRTVEIINGFFLVADEFDSSYNGGSNLRALTLNGGVKANRIRLSRGTFAPMNEDDPSERFLYNPKYIINFSNMLGDTHVRWREVYD